MHALDIRTRSSWSINQLSVLVCIFLSGLRISYQNLRLERHAIMYTCSLQLSPVDNRATGAAINGPSNVQPIVVLVGDSACHVMTLSHFHHPMDRLAPHLRLIVLASSRFERLQIIHRRDAAGDIPIILGLKARSETIMMVTAGTHYKSKHLCD